MLILEVFKVLPIHMNSNLTVNSTELTQNSNVITITSKPLPYNWDFTGSQNTVTYLKRYIDTRIGVKLLNGLLKWDTM